MTVLVDVVRHMLLSLVASLLRSVWLLFFTKLSTTYERRSINSWTVFSLSTQWQLKTKTII